MISKASAAGKRGRESNVAVKKKSKRAKGAVEEEETGVMGEESDVAVKKKSKRAKGAVEEEETAVEGEESDVAVKKKSKRAKGAVEEEETAVMGEESDVAVKKTSKRAKGAVEEEETAVKSENKKLFQRIFSEKDEIDLLKGITEYYESNGKDIMNDGFYEFIMNSVEVTVNRNQVADKVRRLKKKYANLAKRIEKGKDVSFAKAHDKISNGIEGLHGSAYCGEESRDGNKTQTD
ncbi:hypothetical protein COLO4_16241 [Corchorus olitorius]|uniref:Glabrous enhancer-binding protein-like DBD domain-containing protein n=1 Tax=Corchorus olitorius TaxID=93759 RepID=A0A1R3JIF8_9ROSI|nr:hypothetical protein COLO4_16241 [Corchorus olitorius]